MQQYDLQDVSSRYGGFWSLGIRDFCYMTNPYFPPGRAYRSFRRQYPSADQVLSFHQLAPLRPSSPASGADP